jgi:predicted enzyme related to lactoylglutathione lyase
MSLKGNTQGIDLVWITVKDMNAAIKYYTEVLGFEVVSRHDAFKWAEIKGPQGIHLGLGEGEECCGVKSGGNAIITVVVKDLIKARRELQKSGATLVGNIQEVPGHVVLQTVKDPFGNVLQLCQKFPS